MKNNPATAMILAAGKGERMRPLTLTTPKPLLTVAGKPLIEYHIINLKAAGVKKVVINLAYLGEQIEAYLGDGERYNLEIVYSYEPAPLETAGAILKAAALLGDAPFLLVNGDVWQPKGFASFPCLPNGSLGLLAMVANPSHNPTGDFLLNNEGQLECKPSSLHASFDHYTYSGTAILDPAIVTDYPNKRERFALKEVFDYAINKQQLSGFVYAHEWVDVGTPNRLAAINRQAV